jgi:transposase
MERYAQHPPIKAIVLCVDEKSQIQALERTSPMLPLRPGLPARQTHDYRRHGTVTLFAALNIANGYVVTEFHERHRHQEVLSFLRHISREYPRRQIHIVWDNYGTHQHAEVEEWLRTHPRFHSHFTPTSASWMNQVETFFSVLTGRWVRRGSFRSVAELMASIKRFVDQYNEGAQPFEWTKTAEQILAKAKPQGK